MTESRPTLAARPQSGTRSSAIFGASVMHQRFFPVGHRFTYGVWYALFDLDELSALDHAIPGFAYNRRGLVSFHDRDHGPRDGSPLLPWIQARLAEAGVDLEGGPVRLLCLPRVLGYVFNPLSVWFCHGPAGDLRAILYEVSNTFGESHDYLVPVPAGDDRAVIRTEFDKELFVSPFIDMAARYDFRTRVPDERIAVLVRELAPGGQVLVATLTGTRRRLTGRSLMWMLVRYPLVTLRVTLGIHVQAVRLWLKGAPYRRRGTPPAHHVTVIGDSRPAGGS
ncbi:MAG: DUF1365 domain-containing protein [Actinomycetota bacterium]